MSARKRVRFSDKVEEKQMSEEEEEEDEEEQQDDVMMEPVDDGPPTILAGATIEDLIRQLEPGTVCTCRGGGCHTPTQRGARPFWTTSALLKWTTTRRMTSLTWYRWCFVLTTIVT